MKLKFTGKRQDSESQLDYFGGRYYSKAFGWFLIPDPLLNSGHPSDSQSWNRYSYVSNNPLRFTDPTGFWQWDASKCGANKTECDDYKQKFRNAVSALEQSRDKLKEGSTDRTRLDKVLGLIGKETDKGKLHVGFDDNLNYKGILLTGLTVPNGKGGVNMTLNFALMQPFVALNSGMKDNMVSTSVVFLTQSNSLLAMLSRMRKGRDEAPGGWRTARP